MRIMLACGLMVGGLMTTGSGLAATISVSETADELNADGDCSLREAVQSANQNTSIDGCAAGSSSDTDLIVLSGGTYTLSLTGTENGDASANDLDVTEGVEIAPASGEEVVIEPADASAFGDRAFHLVFVDLNSDEDVFMHDFTIQGFEASGNGGAIFADRGLRLEDMQFSGNSADNPGGAIFFVRSNRELRIDRSSFIGNRSGSTAGALQVRVNGGATVSNSTFVRNHASGNGGALVIEESRTRLQNVTITGNSTDGRGGGFYVYDNGELALRNSILDGNRAGTAGPDCDIASDGSMVLTSDASAYNLVSDDTDCGIGGYTGTISGQSAQLAPAAEYDGVTPMRPPLDGSPVIDAGSCSTGGSSPQAVGSDQRQASRITGDVGTTCDIGAVERNWTPYFVDSTADAGDANIDGTCDDGNGRCTLRAAIDEANDNGVIGLESVVLPEGTFMLSTGSANEDANAEGDLDITRSLIISGAGATETVIDADGIDRAIDIPNVGGSPRSVAVLDLTLRNGLLPSNSGNGGALRVSGGSNEANVLRASGLRVTRSEAPGSVSDGGGIAVEFGGARIVNSTIDSNEAGRGGSGIYFTGGAAGHLQRVTVSGNTAGNRAAIGSYGSSDVRIEHGTIMDNNALSGAQLGGNGRIAVHASVVAGSPGNNCSTFSGGSIVDLGSNVEDNTDCGFISGTQNANVDLAPLADIGGHVPLREPNAGSDAVDAAGSACTAAKGRILAALPFGGTQPQDAADALGGSTGDGTYACDVGAAERQQVRLASGPAAPSDRTVAAGSSDVVMAQITVTNESGEPLDGASTELTVRASGGGVDDADVTAVRLYFDANDDGQLDGGDVQRGAEQSFTADNGRITFDFANSPGGAPPNLASGGSASYLVVYDFASQLAAAPVRPDGRVVLAGLAGGSGALALAVGAFGLRRRPALCAVLVISAALALAACGGGGGGSGGSSGDGSGDGSGGGGSTDGTGTTFAVALEDGAVTGASSGRVVDFRTPSVEGATVTVGE